MLKTIFSKRMLVILLTGFSSGLPLILTGSTLQAWMTEAHVDLAVIGVFSLVGVPYTLKFLWAPFLDRYVPPFLGRRRGWMLIAQVALFFAIAALGFSNPAASPILVALLALLVTFFSATQDIVIDAFRREYLAEEELGLGSSLYINGYRIGMLVAGAFALSLADHLPWRVVYLIMASMMLIGLITSFFAEEPKVEHSLPKSLKEAVIEPFLEYFQRKGALEVLLFVLLYKLGDITASAMTTPFILQTGFSKTEYAAIAKTFGMAATMGGGFVGGVLMLRLGIQRALWLFGFIQMISIFSFSLQAIVGYNIPVLAAVIAFENLASGMGTSAYAAYMASLTNKKFTATQYALLTSFMGIPRIFAAAPMGLLAKQLGWTSYFAVCALMAIPGLLMLIRIAPLNKSFRKGFA